MEVDIVARPKRNESDHIRKSKWKLIPLPSIRVFGSKARDALTGLLKSDRLLAKLETASVAKLFSLLDQEPAEIPAHL